MRTAVLVALVCLTLPLPARAAIYENTITAEDEDAVLAAEQRGDISSATAETLLELLTEGVDLNTAGRDQLYDLPGLTYTDVDALLEYRKAKGRIEDPAELVGAGALTGEQLVQIAPFIRIDGARAQLPVSGKVRAVSQFTTTDNVPPPALLLARLKGPLDLSAGVMAETTRRAVATPTFDAVGDTLVSDGFGYQVHVPRFFLQWSSARRKLVAGTFTAGFAERLVLDNTRRVTPNGIYLVDDYRRAPDLVRTCKLSGGFSEECAAGETNLYITPDYQRREVFRGIAGSIEDVSLGNDSFLSMYAFASYQARSIYQYDIYDRRLCTDPHDDGNLACASPQVLIPSRNSRLIFSTLPYLFDELAGGAHAGVKSGRLALGVTGYGAAPFFHASPAQLDFQETAKYPNGGAFGSVGLNAAWAQGDWNLFLEAARSFDQSVGNNGGGWAVEERNTFSPKGHEFEFSFRYYDLHFLNPYARPISSPDEFDGQRARNELGARVRYFTRPNKDWQLRARVDAWVNPFAEEGKLPAGVPNVYGFGRVDFTGWDIFQPSLWVDARNRNLFSTGRGTCTYDPAQLAEANALDASLATCGGDSYRVALRLESTPARRLLRLALQGTFVWADDVKYHDRFRNDVMASLEARSQPLDFLQLHFKVRYRNRDISDNTYLEQDLWTWLEVAWLPVKGTRVAARYDLVLWLDQRASTLTRVPNPEHRLMLDVRTSF